MSDVPEKKEWKAMVQKHFPKVRTYKQVMDILWSLTAFPFMGTQREEGFAHYDKQLAELSKKSEGNLERAFAISDAEVEQSMQATSRRNKHE